MPLHLQDLNFDLPPELIAQEPAEPRDSARLLVYDRSTQGISHHHIFDLPALLPPQTVLVANRSRVRKGRLNARVNDRDIEILILEAAGNGSFECMLGGKGVQPGNNLTLANGHQVTVQAPHTEAAFTSFIIDFHLDTLAAEALIAELGTTPLPPYITGSHAPDTRYQTVFAQELGSAAAPTAGLHFTPELIAKLKAEGFDWEEIVLHVGMGTFQPLRNDNVTENSLHHELTSIDQQTAKRLEQARGHRPILTVGTTSCRTLESHSQHGPISPGQLSTDLFIYPGYTFKVTDLLLTNFHLPKSSLLLLVAALIADKQSSPEQAIAELKRVYSVAITERYRFFSFGDAMLIR